MILKTTNIIHDRKCYERRCYAVTIIIIISVQFGKQYKSWTKNFWITKSFSLRKNHWHYKYISICCISAYLIDVLAIWLSLLLGESTKPLHSGNTYRTPLLSQLSNRDLIGNKNKTYYAHLGGNIFIAETYWNLVNSSWFCLFWISECINYVWEVIFPITCQINLGYSCKNCQLFLMTLCNHTVIT
jgi:hypothetical protein